MPQKMNDGGPVEEMSLRDWFAGQVLAEGWSVLAKSDDPLSIAKSLYAIADAMLEVRKG